MHLTKKGGFCVCFRRDLLNKVVSFVFNALIDFFLKHQKLARQKNLVCKLPLALGTYSSEIAEVGFI